VCGPGGHGYGARRTKVDRLQPKRLLEPPVQHERELRTIGLEFVLFVAGGKSKLRENESVHAGGSGDDAVFLRNRRERPHGH
jgi:hypothetical protein